MSKKQTNLIELATHNRRKPKRQARLQPNEYHSDGSLKGDNAYLLEIVEITKKLKHSEYRDIFDQAYNDCLQIMFAGIKD